MFSSGNGYSLADVAAATGQDGFGSGNGAWWIIILFLFMFMGWGGNGWGGNNGALTRGELAQDMNFQSLENSTRGIQSGLCDGFYAMNTGMLNGFSGLQNNLTSEFRGIDNAVCTLGYNTQEGINSVNTNNMQNTFALQQSINGMNVENMQNANAIQRSIDGIAVGNLQNTNALQSQIASCCCDNKAAIADLKYNMSTDTCGIVNTIQNTTRDIIDNQNCNTRSILDFLVNDKISSLETENAQLRLSASQERQNNYLISALKPTPVPAFPASSLYPYGNSCGC
jgi:hypothetical protein